MGDNRIGGAGMRVIVKQIRTGREMSYLASKVEEDGKYIRLTKWNGKTRWSLPKDQYEVVSIEIC